MHVNIASTSHTSVISKIIMSDTIKLLKGYFKNIIMLLFSKEAQLLQLYMHIGPHRGLHCKSKGPLAWVKCFRISVFIVCLSVL